MAYKDLQEFMERLETRGWLVRIKEPVSPELEIAEITSRVSKKGGPALLFENVTGHGMSVLTNAFGSVQRMSLALGTSDLDRLAGDVLGFIQQHCDKCGSQDCMPEAGPSGLEHSLSLWQETAKCQEIVLDENAVDLGILPVLKCWPGDAGKCITLPLVFTRDPVSGVRNVGMYRMQVYDRNTTGMHWYPGKGGANHYAVAEKQKLPLEAAVVIGPDPVMTYAASAPLPEGMDEVSFAGFLRKHPVELVRCRSIDMEVPACSQVVLEGCLIPGERRVEGPFGNHTGYYSPMEEYPVFHVRCITMRRDAVYQATVPGPPPQEDCYMAKATERLFLPLLKRHIPDIRDINLPLEGIFGNLAFVSIRKLFPGHARDVVRDLWNLPGFSTRRITCVFDSDVDVQDLSQVLWRLGNNLDPGRDVLFSDGPSDPLNAAAANPQQGSRMGMDCTRKWKDEGYGRQWPREIQMDCRVRKRVDFILKEMGL